MSFRKAVCSVMVFGVMLLFLDFKGFAAEEISAKSAVLIDADTKAVLFEKDAYTKRPMASTTKIMTALLALEREDVHTQFEVDYKAICVEGSSMGLMRGDRVSLYSLAVGMLTVSGNDAANAAAVRISGSQQEFSQLMNERAEKIGMKSTSFKRRRDWTMRCIIPPLMIWRFWVLRR